MVDLTQMLINLSHSLQPVQKLLSALGYLIGILMIISGLVKLKQLAGGRQGGQQEGAFTAVAFLVGGAFLLYLPSSVSVMANTFFGATNILSYTDAVGDPFWNAMMLLIKTAGLIWFVRGTVLLVNASKPGEQNGPKGFTFLIAGILAMNVDNTLVAVNYAFDNFFAMMTSVKNNL